MLNWLRLDRLLLNWLRLDRLPGRDGLPLRLLPDPLGRWLLPDPLGRWSCQACWTGGLSVRNLSRMRNLS